MLWLLVFYYGGSATNLIDLLSCIHEDLKDLKILSGLIAALPIGVMIHQFSVLIKNCIVGRLWKEFDDFPKTRNIININNKRIKVDYILERISNLNSFYYVRFDNGILSPFLAWVTIKCFMNITINSTWIILAIVIGFITAIYIPRLWCEIKYYNGMLKKI